MAKLYAQGNRWVVVFSDATGPRGDRTFIHIDSFDAGAMMARMISPMTDSLTPSGREVLDVEARRHDRRARWFFWTVLVMAILASIAGNARVQQLLARPEAHRRHVLLRHRPLIPIFGCPQLPVTDRAALTIGMVSGLRGFRYSRRLMPSVDGRARSHLIALG